uniref:7TM_GPCR_Srx domain-containing protein n=1 Tax=Strongyloides papillosus TaxID=174720 RepID=A0A0N5BPZ0_STREA
MDYVSYTITISALVIGIVANSTAICVIVNYPVEKKNKHFGILLLIQFIAGLLTSVFQSVFSFYLLIIENHLVYIFNIFDSYWYNFSLKRFFISFVFFFLYFNVVYVAGIVIARYYLVCKQNDLNLKQASSIFIFTIIPCICASLAIWITVNEGIPKNILGDWIKKNNISLIGISESTEAIAFDIVSFFSYQIHSNFLPGINFIVLFICFNIIYIFGNVYNYHFVCKKIQKTYCKLFTYNVK